MPTLVQPRIQGIALANSGATEVKPTQSPNCSAEGVVVSVMDNRSIRLSSMR